MSVRKSRVLTIIDPQNCFMDLAEPMPLPVSGAVQDMKRLADVIAKYPAHYDEIIVTLDTHSRHHIAHACRWVNADGKNPNPFTIITHQQMLDGDWQAANSADQAWQLEYLKRLEATGREHTIWPVHGQFDQYEWQVFEPLRLALSEWETNTGKSVRYVRKGMHPDTEQFGVFVANVPIDDAPETHFNWPLANFIRQFDAQDFAGEASSHCVLDSVNQYVKVLEPVERARVTVYRDAMSPVAAVINPETGEVIVDFPATAEAWLASLPAQGITVTTIAETISA